MNKAEREAWLERHVYPQQRAARAEREKTRLMLEERAKVRAERRAARLARRAERRAAEAAKPAKKTKKRKPKAAK